MKNNINYDHFSALDIRIATVIAAELIDGADKLLKITLDVGPEIGQRTIAAGIKPWYSPEELVGKQVQYLTNLEPRKIRGVVSQGMLMAAGGDEAILLYPDKEVEPGTVVR